MPLLVVQAEDDPIAPKSAVPVDALAANPNCVLVFTPTGGHLGWCSGDMGVRGAPWSDRAVTQYFSAVQQLWAAEKGEAAAAAAAAAVGGMEPAGVYTVGSTTHQAP